jgi:hypothetical protein
MKAPPGEEHAVEAIAGLQASGAKRAARARGFALLSSTKREKAERFFRECRPGQWNAILSSQQIAHIPHGHGTRIPRLEFGRFVCGPVAPPVSTCSACVAESLLRSRAVAAGPTTPAVKYSRKTAKKVV